MGLLDSILSALGLRRKIEDDDEPASEDPQDDERDPALEAEDDAGSFDFEGDIARYFTAEFRVETAWDDRERREALFAEYQIRDTKHWYQIKATFGRWLETPAAKAKYRTASDLMQARMTTTQTMTLDDLALERVEPRGEARDDALAPIEGISLERWAKAEAAISGGAKPADLELGVDEDTWAEVSKQWRARMDADGSGEIAAEYSKFVGSAGAGKFGAKSGK
jgi:hypothetical protein